MNLSYYLCEDHGCVYAIDLQCPDDLLVTPLTTTGTFAPGGDDDWILVDFLALLGEDSVIQRRVDEIHNLLAGKTT